MGGEKLAYAAQHAGGVQVDRHARDGVWWLVYQARDQAVHQFGGKVCAGGQGENVGGLGVKHKAIQPAKYLLGDQHRTSHLDGSDHKHGCWRSRYPRGDSG